MYDMIFKSGILKYKCVNGYYKIKFNLFDKNNIPFMCLDMSSGLKIEPHRCFYKINDLDNHTISSYTKSRNLSSPGIITVSGMGCIDIDFYLIFKGDGYIDGYIESNKYDLEIYLDLMDINKYLYLILTNNKLKRKDKLKKIIDNINV